MRKTLSILITIFLVAISSVMASDFNLTMYENDNSTLLVADDWTCTLTNSTGTEYAFTATAGTFNATGMNTTLHDLVCTSGAEATKRYRFAIDDVNLTANLEINISFTEFNLTESHTAGTTYPSNVDITYQLNMTQSGVDNTSVPITVLNYITSSTLASGCGTQTNVYSFNMSQTQVTDVTVDPTGCGFGSFYLDMGVFDTDVLFWNDTNGDSGTGSLYVYRRESITIASSTTAIIAYDTLEGMPQLGLDIGAFLGNLAPGLGKFLLIMVIFIGIGSIITGIVLVISHVVKKGKGFGGNK